MKLMGFSTVMTWLIQRKEYSSHNPSDHKVFTLTYCWVFYGKKKIVPKLRSRGQ